MMDRSITHPGGEEGEVVAHEALHGLLLCVVLWGVVGSGEGDSHVFCMYIHIPAPLSDDEPYACMVIPLYVCIYTYTPRSFCILR